MPAFSFSHHSPLASSTLGPVLRRLLAVLMIWQAAAPLCHSHMDATTHPHPLSLSERFQLAIHLQARHGAPDRSHSTDQTWHTHFGLPTEAVPATEVSLESDVGAALVPALPPFQKPGCISPDSRPLTGCTAGPRPSGGFFSAFAPALPLPMRLCVAQL